MKKLILTSNGREVKMGETINFGATTRYGFVPFFYETITEETLPNLIKSGVIKEVSDEWTHVDVDFYLEHLAKRIHWNIDNLKKYLSNLYDINPASILSIILKEIAIVMDEKYPDHIRDSKEIYIISSISGKVNKIKNLSKIKNFRNFAAFRTVEDAFAAKHILRIPMEQMFKRDGKPKD